MQELQDEPGRECGERQGGREVGKEEETAKTRQAVPPWSKETRSVTWGHHLESSPALGGGVI